MKLKTFLMGLALLAAGTAQAQILSPTAGAVAGAAAGSQSQAGAVSGAGAAAVLIQDVAAPSPNTTASVNYSGTQTIKTAPNIIAPNILPTVPCASVTSAGLSVLGGGFTFGTAHQDPDCNLRETARLMHTMGMASDALDVLCGSVHAAKAKACQTRVAAEKQAEAEAARAHEQAQADEAKRIRDRALDLERQDADRRRSDLKQLEPSNTAQGIPLYRPVMLSGEDDELMKLKPSYCRDPVIAVRRSECQ